MKFYQLATLVIAFGLTFAPVPSIQAKGGAKPAKKKEIPPNHSLVTAISDTSITVSTKAGAQTYTIGEFTTIMVNGKRGKASDIKVGMRAVVGGDSSKKATNISASEAPPAPKK